VPAMTLAQLFAAENISGRAGVVKIDVEGMELPILSELVSDSCLLPARVDIIVEVTSYWYQDGWNDLLPILNAYRQAGFQSAELYDSCKFVPSLVPSERLAEWLSPDPPLRGQPGRGDGGRSAR